MWEGEGDVITEAETSDVRPQAKECWWLLEAGGTSK